MQQKITITVSEKMAEALSDWAKDEMSSWPEDTAYAEDLHDLSGQIARQQMRNLAEENKRLREALAEIANQQTSREVPREKWPFVSFEDGYNGCVKLARDAIYTVEESGGL